LKYKLCLPPEEGDLRASASLERIKASGVIFFNFMNIMDYNMDKMTEDARIIIAESIKAVIPDSAVKKALRHKPFSGDVIVIAVGKAAWTMAKAAAEVLSSQISRGVVITKYGHSGGTLDRFKIIEAGHPIVDENSLLGTEMALSAVSGLKTTDTVLFLLSGGGSSLFEKPLNGISLYDLKHVSESMLKCGADIGEFNTVRKHLSSVKGGRFADACQPASVYSILLSDVLGDRQDVIASGPACEDRSTSDEALAILKKYGLNFSENILNCLKLETPKDIHHCEAVVVGNVEILCAAAKRAAKSLGYQPHISSTQIDGEARAMGTMFAELAKRIRKEGRPVSPPCAVIGGGETVVRIIGKGKGGRNQEMALSAAEGLAGMEKTLFFSLGSDGTDGPTDAAGGIVTGGTREILLQQGISIPDVLDDNNSYETLARCGGLIITGVTGTNVNDLQVLLLK
jgi:hydroxypyruvate reductase